jgi:hypothetical protein
MMASNLLVIEGGFSVASATMYVGPGWFFVARSIASGEKSNATIEALLMQPCGLLAGAAADV